MVVNDGGKFQAKLDEAETTVLLTGPRAIVKASYAYRKGELKDKDIEQILADLPRITTGDKVPPQWDAGGGADRPGEEAGAVGR